MLQVVYELMEKYERDILLRNSFTQKGKFIIFDEIFNWALFLMSVKYWHFDVIIIFTKYEGQGLI